MIACATANVAADKTVASLNTRTEIQLFLYSAYTITAIDVADAIDRTSVIIWSPWPIMWQLKMPVPQYDRTKVTFHEE